MPKLLPSYNMSEKLCLKWNDYQENVNIAFGNLREDREFADVACEDGQQIEAHKVILAASSPFFQNLLQIIHWSKSSGRGFSPLQCLWKGFQVKTVIAEAQLYE